MLLSQLWLQPALWTLLNRVTEMADSTPPTGSIFESLQRTVFDVARRTFGFEASWTPVGGGESYEARVLFSNPTEAVQHLGIEWNAETWYMEYYLDDFPGLKASVDARANKEVILIEEQEYYIRSVTRKADGKTYLAMLKIKL